MKTGRKGLNERVVDASISKLYPLKCRNVHSSCSCRGATTGQTVQQYSCPWLSRYVYGGVTVCTNVSAGLGVSSISIHSSTPPPPRAIPGKRPNRFVIYSKGINASCIARLIPTDVVP